MERIPGRLGLQLMVFGAGKASAQADKAVAPVASGENWTERANPKNFNLTAVAYNGSNLYVAGGFPDGTDTYLISSPDGITWTERANPKNTFINGIVFAEGLFVAVGNADATDAYIITSPDGITWTERSNPEATRLAAVIHDNGTFIAVGNKNVSNEDYIVTSPDGITWTQRDTTGYLGRNLRGLAGDGAGNIVAVGIESCVSSGDGGVTWTDRRSNLPNVNLVQNDVVYDGTRFVMLDGGGGGIWTNTTGTTSWVDETMIGDYIDNNDNGSSIFFNAGVYIISGVDGATPSIWRSTDFLTWVKQTITVTNNATLQGVIFGGGLWVSVGGDDSAGPDAYLNTSP